MHEMLHFASGCRAPVVMACVNRTLAAPWAFWSDQTDSLAQRDTGWIQIYCEDNQESLDSVIQAFRIAEKVLLPCMVVLEANFISHFMEPVEVPEQESGGSIPARRSDSKTLRRGQPRLYERCGVPGAIRGVSAPEP